MSLYNDKVMEYFMNPHNVGEIEDADGKGTYGSPVCGDMMQITIKVDKDTDNITDAKFKTFGCGSAIASSSMATDMIIGNDCRRSAGTFQPEDRGRAGRSSSCKDPLFSSGRTCHQVSYI